ncbi:Hint domain-containing protein [Paracoccus sp. Z330]|uniref:Hint domain-containing protein n=1 Tax=Paracoccus onchidii TaxID=3017813 RepID=A0ABT4ZK39_9RHOB|nr:Hint domain-containing protein [Paracoccus onchidii]MDB6179652.1 Hint domain-containing protein [Paracoccus onchidii]
MVDYVINADALGQYSQAMGNNGTDDTTTVNIFPGFQGTISVLSDQDDGEIDNTIVNLPAGWTLSENITSELPGETPPTVFRSYDVLDSFGFRVGSLNITTNEVTIPCFGRGTMIDTPRGAVPIETLSIGDHVITRDHGAQPLRWIGSKALDVTTLMLHDNLRPIRIAAGALGARTPSSDLLVSPQHRMLIRSRIAQRMFGTTEVLVAAKQLLELPGVEIARDLVEVEYFHILFERHEVVIANGAETESLYTGAEALKAVGPAAIEEIFAIFPELRDAERPAPAARILVPGRMGRKLAERHHRNGQKLVSA